MLKTCVENARFIQMRGDTFGERCWSVRAELSYLQTPHLPPSLAQWRQYLQFLQALQGSLPVHVAAENTSSGIRVRSVSDRNKREANDKILFVVISETILSVWWKHLYPRMNQIAVSYRTKKIWRSSSNNHAAPCSYPSRSGAQDLSHGNRNGSVSATKQLYCVFRRPSESCRTSAINLGCLLARTPNKRCAFPLTSRGVFEYQMNLSTKPISLVWVWSLMA
jgi:hypothetical protein